MNARIPILLKAMCLVAAGLLFAGCAKPNAPAATDAPAITDTPAATDAPAITEVPEATAATEAPAATDAALPKAGALLYRSMGSAEMEHIRETAPVRIDIRIDHGGPADTAEVTDPETIQKLVDAFTRITLSDAPAEDVTDNYNAVTFTFPNGKSATLSLCLKSYECGLGGTRTLYTLSDFDAFWNLINKLATPEA